MPYNRAHAFTLIALPNEGAEAFASKTPAPLHTLFGRSILEWSINPFLSLCSEAKPIVYTRECDEAHMLSRFAARFTCLRFHADYRTAIEEALLHVHTPRVIFLAPNLPLLLQSSAKSIAYASESAAFFTDAAPALHMPPIPVFMFDVLALRDALSVLPDERFSSMIHILERLSRALPCAALPLSDEEALLINDRAAFSDAAAVLRCRINRRHMQNGVSFIDPSAAYIDDTVTIGMDATVYPNVILEGDTHIGEDTVLYPACHIKNSSIGRSCALRGVVANEAVLMDHISAGPYVHLRPGARIESFAKIGNYIEIKNANVGEGAKLPHLSYIGDADIGARSNLGCGAVTANYDGEKKHRTTVGENAFIGCNTSLVAPVRVGSGAYTAAGSVITSDVPENALALARAQQVNKLGYAKKIREKRCKKD